MSAINEVTITVSAGVGSGKSALLGEIEIMCKALGVPVRYSDEKAAQAEKNGTHADWCAALEMYKPSVVLVEDMPWLRATPAQAEPSGALPELPSSFAQIPRLDGTMCDAYTPNQMRAYAKQAIEARILGQQGGSDAALDALAAQFSQPYMEYFGSDIQDAIKALKAKG